jgi:hypothetical protein
MNAARILFRGWAARRFVYKLGCPVCGFGHYSEQSNCCSNRKVTFDNEDNETNELMNRSLLLTC